MEVQYFKGVITMTGISGFNSIGTLFGFGTSKSSSSSPFSALTSSLSDYNMIRSGSYKKMMTAYFAKTDASAFRSSFNTKTKTNSTSKDSAETLTKVQGAAEDLKDSASKLLKTGTSSVFSKESTKDDTGKTALEYNKDKIYSAVKSFVDDYNEMIKAADDAKTSGIQKTAISMINGTSRYESSLSKIGITIDSDNFRLSIDKDTFMKADMNQVKTLFNGSGSFASNVKSQASMMEFKAENEASRANTYSRYGSYNSTYSSGSMWDSYY